MMKRNRRLVFATMNQNKLVEMQGYLSEIEGLQIISLGDIDQHIEIEETGGTLEENAQIKAEFVNRKYDIDSFAEDTGLEVMDLDGEPGVYSARYAGPKCDSFENMNKLLKRMKGIENRAAQFRTVIALIQNGETHFFTGVVEGTIAHEKRGSEGFGYDPLFVPNGFERSFAEMTIEEKNAISHRGRATRSFVQFMKTQQSIETK